MKFVVDAQLPRRMVTWLRNAGCDAAHTLDLPNGNRTADDQLIDFADRELRVLITKDGDFVDSHLLFSRPSKLLLISTGNISNADLELIMVPLIPNLVTEFQSNNFMELNQSGILARE